MIEQGVCRTGCVLDRVCAGLNVSVQLHCNTQLSSYAETDSYVYGNGVSKCQISCLTKYIYI